MVQPAITLAAAAVNLASGDPIKVEITCIGGVAHVVLSNTVTAATFVGDLPVGDLAARLGGETAWMGLTGADGGTPSTQYVSEFRYIPLPTLTAQSSGASVVLSWPASIGGYKLQSTASLSAPAWADAGLTETIVGNQYQATVSAGAGNRFYRLVLQQ